MREKLEINFFKNTKNKQNLTAKTTRNSKYSTNTKQKQRNIQEKNFLVEKNNSFVNNQSTTIIKNCKNQLVTANELGENSIINNQSSQQLITSSNCNSNSENLISHTINNENSKNNWDSRRIRGYSGKNERYFGKRKTNEISRGVRGGGYSGNGSKENQAVDRGSGRENNKNCQNDSDYSYNTTQNLRKNEKRDFSPQVITRNEYIPSSLTTNYGIGVGLENSYTTSFFNSNSIYYPPSSNMQFNPPPSTISTQQPTIEILPNSYNQRGNSSSKGAPKRFYNSKRQF